MRLFTKRLCLGAAAARRRCRGDRDVCAARVAEAWADTREMADDAV